MAELIPPHDVLGRVIGEYLPDNQKLREMMEKSYDILNSHPLNTERAKKGLNKANSIWFWGAGTRPALDLFEGKYGKKGAMISAVDLLKGIAEGTGMYNINVPGADVYIHLEAPDEMGHQGSLERKIKAIEYLDSRVLDTILKKMDASGEDYRVLVMPDHPTPVSCRTHTSDPVPYMLYDSTVNKNTGLLYNEKDAAKSGNVVEHGYTLMGRLLQ